MVAGALVVVGTPIGNLGDLSPRAVEALGSVDALACEDTRRTGRLLVHAGVAAPPLLLVNEHTERQAAAGIVARIAAGERIGLVSDAGMPLVSDPGGQLVAAVVAAGLAVEVVPGPTAMTAALALAGIDTSRVAFEGFLPRSGTSRRDRLEELAAEVRTLVLYEAPHRLARTLADLADALGPARPAAWCREVTKLHEEVRRATLGTLAADAAAGSPRGEYVLVVAGRPPLPEAGDETVRAAVRAALDDGCSVRDASRRVAAALGVARTRAYEVALELAAGAGGDAVAE